MQRRRRFWARRFPHSLSFLLELPLRKFLLSPKHLAERLELRATSQVLEVVLALAFTVSKSRSGYQKGGLNFWIYNPRC